MTKYRVKLIMSGTIIDVVEADNQEEAISKLSGDYPDFNILEEEAEEIE